MYLASSIKHDVGLLPSDYPEGLLCSRPPTRRIPLPQPDDSVSGASSKDINAEKLRPSVEDQGVYFKDWMDDMKDEATDETSDEEDTLMTDTTERILLSEKDSVESSADERDSSFNNSWAGTSAKPSESSTNATGERAEDVFGWEGELARELVGISDEITRDLSGLGREFLSIRDELNWDLAVLKSEMMDLLEEVRAEWRKASTLLRAFL